MRASWARRRRASALARRARDGEGEGGDGGDDGDGSGSGGRRAGGGRARTYLLELDLVLKCSFNERIERTKSFAFPAFSPAEVVVKKNFLALPRQWYYFLNIEIISGNLKTIQSLNNHNIFFPYIEIL